MTRSRHSIKQMKATEVILKCRMRIGILLSASSNSSKNKLSAERPTSTSNAKLPNASLLGASIYTTLSVSQAKTYPKTSWKR